MEAEADEDVAVMSKTSRGKDKLFYCGYAYTLDRVMADGVHKSFRCEYKDVCKVRLRYNCVTGACVVSDEHIHDPEPAKLRVVEVVEDIKRRARDTQEVSYGGEN